MRELKEETGVYSAEIIAEVYSFLLKPYAVKLYPISATTKNMASSFCL